MLGVVDADRVAFYRDVVKRHTAKSEFEIGGVTKLPKGFTLELMHAPNERGHGSEYREPRGGNIAAR